MLKDMLIQLKFRKKKTVRTNDKFRNMNLVQELFQRTRDENCIDDNTSCDLGIDDLFKKVDYTSTTPGEQVLYKMLREPIFQTEKLLKRDAIFSYFESNKTTRDALIQVLGKISTNRSSVADIIDKPMQNFSKLKWIYNGGAMFFLCTLLLYAFLPTTTTMLLLVPSMLINIYLHFTADKVFLGRVESVFYLGKIINSIKTFQELLKDSPLDQYSTLEALNQSIGHIGRKVTLITYVKSIPLIGENIALLFLVRERFFLKSVKEIIKYGTEVMDLYALIGDIDASLSIVDFRDSLNQYSKPVFVDDEISLRVTNVCHPLLEKPVGNDFVQVSNGVVITGSNMSGKSTFLRTLGINAIMAQTIYTVLAENYQASFFNVISSISLNDNMTEGRSYYKSEAVSIHRIIEKSEGQIPVLSLIDEIFKGTNPIERISASAEILSYIGARNVLSIVTTHDIDLLPFVKSYDTYYFSEQVTNNQLTFDYKIKKGVSPSGNAVKILALIGYPPEIISRTYQRVSELANGRIYSEEISKMA